jgi:hypothetical protein
MVRIIKASTKSIRPVGCSKVEARADDVPDESEFSGKELSDEDSDNRSSM